MTTPELRGRITLDDKASKVLSGFNGRIQGMKTQLRTAGIAVTAIGGALTGLAALAIKSSQEEQIGINRLDQSLKNVGESYDAQREAIERVIEAQQRKTNFGDEEQRDALQKLVTIGGQWEGTLDALTVTTDVAAGANIDLSAAALLVGKAIAGETSSLSRYGILLEKGATQTEIMAALTKQFGGAAEAAADPITQMKNRLGDLLQVLGDALLPIVEKATVKIEEITRKMIGWAEEHPQLTKFLFLAGAAVGALLLILGPLLIILPLLAAGMALVAGASGIGLVILATTALVAGVTLLVLKWDSVWNQIKNITNTVGNSIIDVFNKITTVQRLFIRGMLEVLQAVANVGSVLPIVGEQFDAAASAIQKAIDVVKEGVPNFELATNAAEDFGDVIQEVGNQANEAGNKMAEGFQKNTQVIIEALEDRQKIEGKILAAIAKDRSTKNAEYLTDLQLSQAEELRIRQETADETNRILNSIQDAFNSQTDNLLFNFSAQGSAWNDLGGTAQKVILAMSATTGQAASEIAAAFSAMRQEGESWKDLLLRLDTEGVLNLGNLQAAMEALTNAAKETFKQGELTVHKGPSFIPPPGGVVMPGVFAPGSPFTGNPLDPRNVPSGSFIPGGVGSGVIPIGGGEVVHVSPNVPFGDRAQPTTVNHITIEGSLLAGDQAVGAAVQRILESGGLEDFKGEG